MALIHINNARVKLSLQHIIKGIGLHFPCLLLVYFIVWLMLCFCLHNASATLYMHRETLDACTPCIVAMHMLGQRSSVQLTLGVGLQVGGCWAVHNSVCLGVPTPPQSNWWPPSLLLLAKIYTSWRPRHHCTNLTGRNGLWKPAHGANSFLPALHQPSRQPFLLPSNFMFDLIS